MEEKTKLWWATVVLCHTVLTILVETEERPLYLLTAGSIWLGRTSVRLPELLS